MIFDRCDFVGKIPHPGMILVGCKKVTCEMQDFLDFSLQIKIK